MSIKICFFFIIIVLKYSIYYVIIDFVNLKLVRVCIRNACSALANLYAGQPSLAQPCARRIENLENY